MNNLHRELAPISEAAWAEIEEEASRTLKRHLAARRVVDVQGPKGVELSAVGTGHLLQIQAPGEGVQAVQREAKALVELRVPFELTRQAIDDVERGRDRFRLVAGEGGGARKIAFAEDRAVFDGYAAAGIQGIREGREQCAGCTSRQCERLFGCSREGGRPIAPRRRQRAVRADTRCRGVYGRQRRNATRAIRSFTISSAWWTEGLFGRPPIEGGFVVTTRGGDFELDLGQDISIGYQSHSNHRPLNCISRRPSLFGSPDHRGAAVVLAPGEKK